MYISLIYFPHMMHTFVTYIVVPQFGADLKDAQKGKVKIVYSPNHVL